MRKLQFLIPFCMLTGLFTAGCKPSSFGLNYFAEEGGYLLGDSMQSVERGERGLEVEAVPKDGYLFVEWSDGGKDAKRTDSPSGNLSLTARFQKVEQCTLEYLAGEGGFVVGNPLQTLRKGESGSEVEAVPKEGYTFRGWSDGVTSSERKDENVSEDKKVTAEFEKIITHTAVYSAGEGGYIVGDREQTVIDGENATSVEAIPKAGYVFQGWSDGKTDSLRTDEALTQDISPEALFKRVYDINIFSIDENIGKVTGGGRFQCSEGETLTVEAVPAVGYKFAEWSDGGKEAKRTISPMQDMELYAAFETEPLSLPVFEIDTEEKKPIADKENYIPCTVSLSNTERNFEFLGETGKIKGRGNTTWDMAKKPYKLKFDEKVDLFGFGEAKTWVLLADFSDKSLLRNRLVQAMGETLGLEYNNKTMPVELYLNGEYLGEYLLCKQTEAGKNRVNIDEAPNTTDPAFLVELDSRAYQEGVENVDWFVMNGLPYAVKSPETDEAGYPAEATLAIQSKLQEFWIVLESGDFEKVKKQIDVESFAKTYIVNELTHNNDVTYSSWFLYRDKAGKLKSGPLWDFDLSIGNVDYNDAARNPKSLTAVLNAWYQKLLGYPEFKTMVGRFLKEYQSKVEKKVTEIVEEAKLNKDSYLRNFERWNILGQVVWPNPPEIAALHTWEEQVDFVVNFLKESYAFLLETYS